MIADYFHTEFDAYDKGERMHLLGSTLRRLFLLLYAPVVRFALSAPDNQLEYRSILQENRVSGMLQVKREGGSPANPLVSRG